MAYRFIVLEGIDGTGKQTQAEEIAKYLKKRRQPFCIHKYPTEGAKDVHAHLLGKKKLSGDGLFEAYAADLEAGQEKLKTDLKKGWVIADRYCVSTAAYQGVGGLLEKRCGQLEGKGWIKPDLVIYLSLPVDEAFARKSAQKKLDVHEADQKFMQDVSANYEELLKKSFMCNRWVRVDASQAREKIAQRIIKAIEGLEYGQ